MHVGLIDIDGGNFPNLCLMKLSTHYKRQGHTIYMLTIDDVLKGQSLFTTFSRIFGACVYCAKCDAMWRTKAKYVNELKDGGLD